MAVPAAATAGTPAAGHLRVAIDTASRSADFSRTAGRQRFVVLHEWEQGKLRALKAADPTIRVLLYKDLSAMMKADPWGNVSTGVTTQEAASHPEWYLLNTSGQRFTFGAYGWMYAADVGHPGYQQRWVDNVLAKLQAQGWDGVFADDTNPTIKYHYDPARVAKYPSDAAYGAATGSMLAAVGPRIQAAGKLIIPNFGSWSGYRPVVDGWLQHVSGGMEEMFAKWGNTATDGYVTGNGWERQLGAIKAAEARGKFFLGITHSANTDAAAARYGWATMLLAAQGRSSFALHGDYTNETWFDDYDAALGAPIGEEWREPSGVHRRVFEGGLVLVNPTAVGVSVDFGGAYSGSGLSHAVGAVMAPHTGLVLERVGDPEPQTPPSPTPSPAPTAAPSPAPTAAPTPAAPPSPTTPRTHTMPAAAGALVTQTPVATGPRRQLRPRRSSSVRVRVTCKSRRRGCRHRIVLKARHRAASLRVGRRSVRLAARRSTLVRVALSRRARRLLRGAGSLAVIVSSRPLARSGRVRVMPSLLRVR